MKCPVCDGFLESRNRESVAYHICSDCFGIWVADQQFHTLATNVAAKYKVNPCAKLNFKPREIKKTSPESHLSRICPHCNVAMKEFNYAYDSNIFLDRCDTCKGIWLDPNEIIDVAKHIQYNPEVEALAKSLLDFNRNLGKSKKDLAHDAMKGYYFDTTLDVFWA